MHASRPDIVAAANALVEERPDVYTLDAARWAGRVAVGRGVDHSRGRAAGAGFGGTMASLESIHLQNDLDGSPRFATMRPVLGALLVPGRGIKTHKLDSSFGGTGALLSDDLAYGLASRDPTRQLTVMSAHRSGEHRRDAEGREVFSPEHRPKRNLVVSGITPQELEGAIGGKLMIGLDAEVVVHGRVQAKDGAGGVRCEVIRGGSVRVGDSVYVGDLSKEDTDWRIERDIKDEIWHKRGKAGWAEPPECRFLRPELGPVTRLRR